MCSVRHTFVKAHLLFPVSWIMTPRAAITKAPSEKWWWWLLSSWAPHVLCFTWLKVHDPSSGADSCRHLFLSIGEFQLVGHVMHGYYKVWQHTWSDSSLFRCKICPAIFIAYFCSIYTVFGHYKLDPNLKKKKKTDQLSKEIVQERFGDDLGPQKGVGSHVATQMLKFG